MQEFIRHIGPEVNVISVCQPTVPVLAAVSLMASRGEFTPRTMTMMGGPIDARKSPTAVNNLAMNKSHEWFEHNVIYRVPQNYPGATRRVYPGFLQHTGFVAMNPDRHLSSHYDYFLDLVRGDDDSAEATASSTTSTTRCSTCRPSTTSTRSRSCSRTSPWSTAPGASTASWCSRRTSRTSALLTIEGELDDISGAGQTRAAHDLCTGIPKARHFHYDAEGAGHYGIFSGRRWREQIYPRCASSSPASAAARTRPRPAAAAACAKRRRARTRDGATNAAT